VPRHLISSFTGAVSVTASVTNRCNGVVLSLNSASRCSVQCAHETVLMVFGKASWERVDIRILTMRSHTKCKAECQKYSIGSGIGRDDLTFRLTMHMAD